MTKIQAVMNKINAEIVDEAGMQNVGKVLKSGFLSKPEGGKFVKMFQKKMSQKIGRKYALTTNSGTSALHGAVLVLKLKKNDEVLIPALTFFADASVVLQENVTPVFVDVSPDDFNIDPVDLEKKITKNSKAIIVVHLYGKPARMDEIINIAKKHKLIVIEDCAQAAGAKIGKKYVGSMGDIACFSFYQSKHLVTGEGGMILTDNPKYFESLKSILNNGVKRQNLDEYNFDHLGVNYQLSEMQAAIGLAQLKRLDKLNKIRRKHADIYRRLLADIGLSMQSETQNYYNVYCHFSCLLPKTLKHRRDEFIKKVTSFGVPVKKLYPLTLPETDMSKKLHLGNSDKVPVANDISERIINLFVNPGLSGKDINRFSKVVIKILNKFDKQSGSLSKKIN